MIEPVRQVGSGLNFTLHVSYNTIVETIGFEPNVTDMDDPSKVKASWGFAVDGVRCGIWCYKHYGAAESCNRWSYFGPLKVAQDLFGEDKVN